MPDLQLPCSTRSQTAVNLGSLMTQCVREAQWLLEQFHIELRTSSVGSHLTNRLISNNGQEAGSLAATDKRASTSWRMGPTVRHEFISPSKGVRGGVVSWSTAVVAIIDF